MKYSSSDIEKMKSELNIVEVVGEYVELKRSGVNFKGLCPFHKDNNPSFIVSPNKNICKCFVCGAGGDPVSFYMEHNKLAFPQAMNDLNEKYNMGIKGVKGNFDKYSDVNVKYQNIINDALEYFKKEIFSNNGRDALEYLSKRQLDPEFITENQIGFAPKGWSNLSDYLLTKEHDLTDIVTLGLVKEGEKGHYDAFRNRIMFPIFSPTGNVIAFGGRTLEDKKEIPKYINSPESPIFYKGKNLYGIKDRGSVIRRKAYSILMEGYMDVLSGHSFGFDVAVASLGTAFTEDQAKLLKRYTSNVIIGFDMDNAGRTAAAKTGILLKKYGFNIRVLEFENAKDPDEFLKKYGKQEFLKIVKNSKEIFDYLYEFYVKEYDLSNFMAKQNFINRFKEFFQNIDTDLEKVLYIDKLSISLDVDKDLLKDILIVKNQRVERVKQEFKVEKKSKKSSKDTLEAQSLKVILKKPKYIEYFLDCNIKSPLTKKVFEYLKGVLEDESNNINGSIIKEMIKSGDFDLGEQGELIDLDMSADIDDIEKYTEEVIRGWLREGMTKLSDECKASSDIIGVFKIKKLKDQLREEMTLDKLQEIKLELNRIEFSV